MKTINRKSFGNLAEFREFAKRFPVVYFHVFEGTPSLDVLEGFRCCREDEELICLDVAEDRGFLAETKVTVEISKDHQFVSKPLAEVRGFGAWVKGNLVDIHQDVNCIPDLLQRARRFGFPPVAGIKA